MPRGKSTTPMPADTPPVLGEGLLGHQILVTAHAYRAALATALAETTGSDDLTPSRLLALQVLADGKPRTGADIGRALSITQQSAAYVVGALEYRGWIARTPGRGRYIHNVITRGGRAALETGLGVIAQVEHELRGCFTENSSTQLALLLGQARTVLAPPVPTAPESAEAA